ncbi:hypothetical protein VTN96DRAFT_5397 [Rasamsonia emersonii]|uniref:LipA and NB-ARC domain protein n=1 Tax=Rasamsonia emersonii (strain ATCC 16479 / CBS 393.64 / IMI 116815) TaxID=1408163 RepID=A0A0F4Z4N8_RASE3|nr:LipA and NB-ARC domain protein [Rasamsonia emersonii CBS 393.64]KKA25499.1 LipA and NB-ARC domain protein [Rasamsonia emersonii CBS 393.64]
MASPPPVGSSCPGRPPDHGGKPFQIRRKPVAAAQPAAQQEISGQEVGVVKTSPAELAEKKRPSQEAPSTGALERPDVSLQTSLPPRIADGPVYASPASASTNTSLTNTPSPAGVSSSSKTESSSGTSQSSAASYVQKAYREARHFVGGLIQHPTESTKHYTILRHSHGIVFYQGSYTFLAVSIFADTPLPADRTLWMQSKGWTGKTGMRARALLGLTDSWINVTPTTPIRPDQVKPSDERAWQRDISRFRKKGPQPMRERHQLRETAIVRIPVEAGDGYFQLVLCQGEKKKVLCYSPVFRVISTSSDPSSLRGASLSTLPLELGAYIASTYATNTVQSLIAPVTQTVQNVLQPYLPSWKTQQALSTAYSVSGMEDRVGSTIEDANSRLDQVREQAFTRAGGEEVDLEAGPAPPYPIDFVGRVEEPIQTECFAPRMKVGGVPAHVSQRLYGHYFGWARLLPEQRGAAAAQPGPWQQSVISATSAVAEATAPNVRSDQAFKTKVSIRFIDDVDVEIQPRSRIEVRVMGFVRSPQASSASPSPSPSGSTSSLQKGIAKTGAGDDAAAAAAAEERMLLEAYDASLAQSTLDHPAWAPDAPVARKNEKDSERVADSEKQGILDRTKDRYAQALISGQRAIDRVPLHKLGVRMGTHELKDKMVPVSGFYIPR